MTSAHGGSDCSFVAVWEFQVSIQNQKSFERIYGPHGDWARLFKKAAGYIRTELHRDLNAQGRYLTLDLWRDKTAYLEFREKYAQEYAALDASCEPLTETEDKIGEFEPVDVTTTPAED